MGSSPLTRGKLYKDRESLTNGGLIPAHAGKTRGQSRRYLRRKAHPRSRGENLNAGVQILTGLRLIPAHAGKTSTKVKTADIETAHPRSRGENCLASLALSQVAGSSPLTRGKRQRDRARRGAGGLIPAHAGKTGGSMVGNLSVGAHPRSRGEN